MQTAQTLMPIDPDGARQLLAQAASAQRRLTRQTATLSGALALHEPFDPMKLYARMAKYYKFSHSEMEQMHFPTFFGYVREANIQVEEERKESDRIRNQGTSSDGASLEGFSVAQPYDGPTVAI